MEILEKIFGSEAKVKIMKLFLFNPAISFDLSDIVDRAKVKRRDVLTEVKNLEKAGMIKRRNFVKEVTKKKGKNIIFIKKRSAGYSLDPSFKYLSPLQNFLIHSKPLQPRDLLKKVSNAGKINILLTAGIFIQDNDSRVDMLVVGDRIKEETLRRSIKNIEALVGKELRYAYFETSDFQYRLSMCDKLVRDILDFPHDTIVDRLGITLHR